MGVWYEIVVTGSEDAVRGFVAGSQAELGGKETVIFGHDLDLEPPRLSQRLLDVLAAGSRHFFFAPSRLADHVVAALRERGRNAEFNLESVKEVVRARLPFTAEAFSPGVAEKIKQTLLMRFPPEVEGKDIEESEVRDPSARGAELYTPEHAYIYRVAGTFVGPLPGIIEMRRRARTLPFVKVRSLELETRPVQTPDRA